MAQPQSANTSAAVFVAAALALGLAAAFACNLGQMWLRWFPAWNYAHWSLYNRLSGGESYYTHGPLVPLVSAVLAMVLLRKVPLPIRPCYRAGAAVLGLAILMHLTGCLARVNFLSGLAMVVMLAGLIMTVLGPAALGRLWFPIAFLLLMVPLPEVSIAQINFRLKMLAADWGVALAGMTGLPIERVGNAVLLEGGKSLVVANVCNGLRTLVSLIGFGALYAYVCQLRGPWRVALFMLAVPVAVVSNAVRVAGLILVADAWGVQAATGWFHDTSGLMIYAVAFLAMFGLEWLILRVGGPAVARAKAPALRAAESSRAPSPGGSMVSALGRRANWIVVAAVGLTAAGAWWLNRAAPPVWTGQTVSRALPAELEIDGRRWHSYDLALDERTLVVLETRDYVFRRYVTPGASPLDMCIVFSQDNRKGTHPPDLCLEGGASTIVDKSVLAVRKAGTEESIPCAELVTQGGGEKSYHLYTYKCGGRYTQSFWGQQSGIFVNGLLGRDASGAMIRVSAPLNADVAQARQRAAILMGLVAKYLDRTLP